MDKSDEFQEGYWAKKRLTNAIKKSGSRAVPKGSCNMCERNTETLYAILTELCPSCSRKVVERGEQKLIPFKIIKEKAIFQYCNWCKKKRLIHYVVNIHLCEKCLPNLSKRMEITKEREKILDKKKIKLKL